MTIGRLILGFVFILVPLGFFTWLAEKSRRRLFVMLCQPDQPDQNANPKDSQCFPKVLNKGFFHWLDSFTFVVFFYAAIPVILSTLVFAIFPVNTLPGAIGTACLMFLLGALPSSLWLQRNSDLAWAIVLPGLFWQLLIYLWVFFVLHLIFR